MTGVKILYGVQATGSGHLKRALILAELLRAQGADLTCLISGGDQKNLIGLEDLEPYELHKGFNLEINKGKVSLPRTIFNSRSLHFFPDVAKIDLAPYELILTDFEPLTAHAALWANREIISFGNHNTFDYEIPGVSGRKFLSKLMKCYVPATTSVGLSWHHFGHPILPPIVKSPLAPAAEADPEKILVYMNWEDPNQLIELFSRFPNYRFHIYTSKTDVIREVGNVYLKPLTRDGSFQYDQETCSGIVTNTGFETISEMKAKGKKVLTKALGSQPEQGINMQILDMLGYATPMPELDPKIVGSWLEQNITLQISYSEAEVAPALARWIMEGADKRKLPALSEGLWKDVRVRECAVPMPGKAVRRHKKKLPNLDFDTVIISDIHFPKDVAEVEYLLEFLTHTKCKKLIINGDFLDLLYRMRSNHEAGKFSEMPMRVFDRLNYMAAHGTEITLIKGNHEGDLPIPMEGKYMFVCPETGKEYSIAIANHVYQRDARGRVSLIRHGHQSDPKSLRTAFGVWSSDVAEDLHDLITLAERRITKGESNTVSAGLKRFGKWVCGIEDLTEKHVEKILNKGKVDIVIQGHLHKPGIKVKDGGLMVNDGDWVGSRTACAVTHEGLVMIIKWGEMRKALGLGKLPSVEDPNPCAAYRDKVTEQQLRMVQRVSPAKDQEKIDQEVAAARRALSEVRIEVENATPYKAKQYESLLQERRNQFNRAREKALPYVPTAKTSFLRNSLAAQASSDNIRNDDDFAPKLAA